MIRYIKRAWGPLKSQPAISLLQRWWMRSVLILICLHAEISACSQTRVLDSLRQQLALHESDTLGIKICINLGTEFSRSDMQQSRAYLYHGIDLARRLGTSYGVSGCYSQLTTSYQNTSQTDSAAKYFSLLKALAGNRNNVDDQINYYMTAGLYYKNMSQFDEAIRNMIKALDMMDKTKHASAFAGQLLNIGNAYINLGNIQKAAEYHLRALGQFEAINNDRGRSFCYQSLGSCYLKLRQYKQAITSYQRSGDLKEKLKDPRGLVATYSGLGNVYLETEEYDLSLLNYRKALEQARQLKLHREVLRNLVNIGVLYAKMNRTTEARRAFKEALPAALQSGDSLIVARLRSELGKLDQQTNNFRSVVENFEARVEAADRAGDLSSKSYGYLDLANQYAKQSDFSKAYEYLQLHYQLLDSVSGKEVVMKFQELEQRYEKEKRERQIDLLKKDQLLSKETLARQEARQQITVVALISVLVFSVLGFFYLRLRHTSKRREELNAVRNSIARDLHDDIGSALSSINIMSQVALNDGVHARTHLQRISESSFKMMEGMSDIVWSINPANESLEKMIIRMKEFAGEILEPANISYSITASGNIELLILDPKIRKSLFLIFKESINNAAKYSEGTEVTIEISASKNKLILRVKDDGKGFPVEVRSTGNGLKNMSSRASDVNGHVTFITAPGAGTEVRMEIPLT